MTTDTSPDMTTDMTAAKHACSDQPYQAEPDDHQCTVPLEDEDGRTYRICQEPVGAERVVGGGEFPDPATPARPPAPGSVAGTDETTETETDQAETSADTDDQPEQPELPWPS
jgi:hypothetical protein